MAKIQVINNCNECSKFDESMYGTRCFHPSIVKPLKEGVKPKKIPRDSGWFVNFPKWCPLDDSNGNE